MTPDTEAACVLINSAWQMLRPHVGRRLPPKVAERVRRKLRDARRLLQGKPRAGPATRPKEARRCYLCRRPVGPDATSDHVIPRSRGGSHEARNLRPAHARCNQIKGDRLMSEIDPREFRA